MRGFFLIIEIKLFYHSWCLICVEKQLMKGLHQKIWIGYGIVILSLFILIYTPISYVVLLLFGKKTERPILYFGYKIIARCLSACLLIRYKVMSCITVDPKESYVLISNHKSMIDVFASEVTTPVIFKFLAKKSTGRMPVLGLLIRRLCILIDRSNKASKQLGFKLMAKNLKEGFSVLIFPEGTRNVTSEPLKSFYNGAFRLAIEEKKSILIQTIIDSDKIESPHIKSLNLKPGTVHVYWDGPFDTKDYTIDRLEELKVAIKEIMLQRIREHQSLK